MPHRASRGGYSRSLPLLLRALLAFVLTLSLGLTTGLSPSAVGAAALVVTTTADTIDAGGQQGCDTIVIADLPGGGDGLISLREAICAANNTAGDDAITFQAGLISPITLISGELVIADNLTITGPGQNALAIDGDGSSRVFAIEQGTTVAISDLTVTGGAAEDFGGGILNVGTLTLARTTVSESDAIFGGGIANIGSLTVSDSTIVGNVALGIGGGLFNAGQAQLTGTTVSGNEARSEGETIGGGIASGFFFEFLPIAPSAAPPLLSLELTRVTVSGNTAVVGGGIAVLDFPEIPSGIAPHTTVIDESTIAGNVACLGGGIGSSDAALTITNSTISGNRATGEEALLDCGEGSEGQLVGGGIATNAALTLTNSTVSGNSADNSGGGLYLLSDCSCAEPATVAIAYSTITGNTSGTAGDGGGGGIYFDSFVESSATPAAVLEEVSLNSSIVAGNTGPAGEADCGGPITSAGHNLVGQSTGCPADGTGDLTTSNIAAVLNTSLAENGGPTKTHALVANSPALNAGDPATCAAVATSRDQRGTARSQAAGCDVGAYEWALLTLTVQTEGTGMVTASPAPASSSGTPDNMTYGYPPGTVVTLTATPGSGQVFARWTIDSTGMPPYGKGWASPLTLTLDANHTARATFAPRPTFSDVPGSHPAYGPITELTARSIIKGYTQVGCDRLGTALPCFGPDDLTQRAQVAALLVRLLGLAGEDHGNGGFTDLAGLAPDLQRAVGTMAHYGIMRGYGGGKFGPFDKISYLQTVQVISRAFVFQGYWARAVADDPTIYPNAALSPGERLDLVTFVKNAGPLPGFANTTGRAPLDGSAPRSWTAEALWLALNAHFSVDQPGKGGFVP